MTEVDTAHLKTPLHGIPVLFKAARVTAHLLQNLALLGLPDLATVETSYGRRWIAANAAEDQLPVVGERVIVVLCSSPYGAFAPARTATLSTVEERGSFYNFGMTLGGYLTTTEQQRLAEDIASWNAKLRPRERFLARGFPDQTITVATNEAETSEAWSLIVSRLRGQPDYEQALFARLISAPTRITIGEPATVTLQIPAGAPISTPQLELTQGAALITEERQQKGRLEVDIAANDSGDVDGGVRLAAAGLVASAMPLHLHVLEADVVIADPNAGPTTISQSSALAVNPAIEPKAEKPEPPSAMASRVRPSEPVLADDVSLQRSELRRLLRDADSSTLAFRLAEIAVDAAPDDPALAAEAGRLLAEAERWQEAATVLGRFDPAKLPRGALYHRFLSDCAVGDVGDARQLLAWLDFEAEESFALLKKALLLLPDHAALALGLHLIREVLTEPRSFDVFRALRDRITTPADVCAFASEMQYISEGEALELLMAHAGSEPPDRNLLELLVEIATATPGNQRLGRPIVALGQLRLEAGEIDSVFTLLQAARTEARLDERIELVAALAETLALESGRQEDAVTLLATEVESALAGGLPEAAAELSALAISIASGNAEAEGLAHDAADRAQRALAASEPLRSLLGLQKSAKVEYVRTEIGGRRLAIFGGTTDEPTKAHLQTTFGFSDVRWIESEKNKPADADAIRNLDSEKTIVVVLTERVGHSRSTPVMKHCQTSGMPCIPSRLGARAITDELISHFWVDTSQRS